MVFPPASVASGSIPSSARRAAKWPALSGAWTATWSSVSPASLGAAASLSWPSWERTGATRASFPFLHAMWSSESPLALRMPHATWPAAIIASRASAAGRRVWVCHFESAIMTGVTPDASGRLKSAPAPRRTRTTAEWPLSTAWWSGVEPESVPTAGLALAASRMATISAQPPMAAARRTEEESSLRACTSPPASSANRTADTLRSRAAWCRIVLRYTSSGVLIPTFPVSTAYRTTSKSFPSAALFTASSTDVGGRGDSSDSNCTASYARIDVVGPRSTVPPLMSLDVRTRDVWPTVWAIANVVGVNLVSNGDVKANLET